MKRSKFLKLLGIGAVAPLVGFPKDVKGFYIDPKPATNSFVIHGKDLVAILPPRGVQGVCGMQGVSGTIGPGVQGVQGVFGNQRRIKYE